MDMSHQEKSIAGSLVAMLVVYGYYFAAVIRHVGRPEISGGAIGRLIFTVIAIIVIETVYHIVMAIESKPEPKDERDVLIEARAYRNAYLLLASGAALVITYFIVAALAGDSASRITLTPFFLVNLILLIMVLAEVMKFVTQLLYYRRGF